MSNKSLGSIKELVKNTTGIKSDSINEIVWEWILKERMKLCGTSTFKEYLDLLIESTNEMQELIELIVIPETWFFRDKGSFDFLTECIKERNNKEENFVLRILSLPCSSGEEPYSIAMTLLDLGLKPCQFKIEAADISKKSLTKGEMAVYGKNSFRGKDLAFREKYFNKTENGYVLDKEVKDLVSFYNYNAIDVNIPWKMQSYHFIFCRNLLIYLDPKAQDQVFKIVKYLLLPDGVLFVGPAETQLARSADFVPLPYSKSYAFGQVSKAKKKSSFFVSFINHYASPKSIKSSPLESLNNNEKRAGIRHHKEHEEREDKDILLQEIIKLADSGCFEEATNLCLRYNNEFGAHPQVYYLLALMQHAVGHEERAEEFFHKAVYLDPTHYEALVYLVLLYEKKGDVQRAEVYRTRAQKIHQLRS